MFSKLFGGGGAAGTDKVQVIDPAIIRQWWEAGSVVLVDVREPNECAVERIEGALNLPLSSFNPARMPAVEAGKHLVIHCRSGVRCGTATGQLLAAGYDGEIIRMRGGIIGWKACGGPTRSGA